MDTIITKTSITESDVIVDFNDTKHTYTVRKTNQKLKGGTTIIKKFLKPFDPQTAGRCARAWNVEEKLLKALWKAKGVNAADFGTVIHQALENFEIYREDGEILQFAQSKQEFNYALPSHPVLRQIVLDFTAIADPLDEKFGVIDVLPEALITDIEHSYSGLVDRLAVLDYDKRVCRLGDFKVNIEADEIDKYMVFKKPFNKLPKTKLSKYALQLSTYSAIMEKHGWTVDGLDAFVYGANGWEYYELEKLDIAPHIFNQE